MERKIDVYLGMEEEEWDCTCGAKQMPCVHICAVAIAQEEQKLKKEKDRQVEESVGVRFVLLSSDEGITLAAETDEKKPKRLSGNLYTKDNIILTDDDRFFLSQMGNALGRVLYRNELVQFLERFLSKNKGYLDGKKLDRVLHSPVHGYVEDYQEGFRVRFIRDPNLLRSMAVLCCTRPTKETKFV